MNIISGKFKRRKLKFPKDRLFRPTKSIVREAIFSKIGQRIEGSSFLDLCSGSGAIGIEAESRGAADVVCVDRDTRYLLMNKDLLDASITIHRMDAIRYLKLNTHLQFDYIYFDPIWADVSVYEEGLELIMMNDMVKDTLFVEHDRTFHFPDQY